MNPNPDVNLSPYVRPAALELASFFEVNAERPNRKLLVQQPALKVMHLTLAPGQALPPHTHPGHHVLVQGLSGVTAVQLEPDAATLSAQQLLSFSGERLVSLHNSSDAPSALLITLTKNLVKQAERNTV